MIPPWFRRRFRASVVRAAWPAAFRPRFEPLDDRATPATLH